jgi:hypothetical protein
VATLYRPETRCLRNTPPFLASLSPTQPSVFPEPRHASNATCCDLPPPPRVVCEPTRPLHQVYTVVITRALGGETTLASLTVFGQQAAASASGWTYDVPLPLNQTFYSSATALQVRHDPPPPAVGQGLVVTQACGACDTAAVRATATVRAREEAVAVWVTSAFGSRQLESRHQRDWFL